MERRTRAQHIQARKELVLSVLNEFKQSGIFHMRRFSVALSGLIKGLINDDVYFKSINNFVKYLDIDSHLYSLYNPYEMLRMGNNLSKYRTVNRFSYLPVYYPNVSVLYIHQKYAKNIDISGLKKLKFVRIYFDKIEAQLKDMLM